MSETNTETGPKTPIIPTPGRNVLVSLCLNVDAPPVQGAGVVVGVSDKNPDEIFVLCSVPGLVPQTLHLGYNEREDVPYSWRWMPYQVQKAKEDEPSETNRYEISFRLILIDTTQGEQPKMVRVHESYTTGEIVSVDDKAWGVAYTMYVPTEREAYDTVMVAYRQNAIDPLVAFARGVPIPDDLLRPQGAALYETAQGSMTAEEYDAMTSGDARN